MDKLKIPLPTFSLPTFCTQGATAASVQRALEANTNQHQAHRRARTAPPAPTRQWHPQPRVLVCALRVPPTPSRLLVCMHICLTCMLVCLVCVHICHMYSVCARCVCLRVLCMCACVRACVRAHLRSCVIVCVCCVCVLCMCVCCVHALACLLACVRVVLDTRHTHEVSVSVNRDLHTYACQKRPIEMSSYAAWGIRKCLF